MPDVEVFNGAAQIAANWVDEFEDKRGSVDCGPSSPFKNSVVANPPLESKSK